MEVASYGHRSPVERITQTEIGREEFESAKMLPYWTDDTEYSLVVHFISVGHQ